jgi:hypothetical protein
MGQGQPLLRAALGDSVQTMTTPDFVTFYMEPELCQSAQSGKHNFIGKLANVVSRAGLEVQYVPFGSEGQRVGTEWSLSHIKSPSSERGLCFRRVYHYPFWQIEQSAERWSWDVAQAAFEPNSSDATEAERFYRFWQNRLFGDAPENAKKNGFIYVPLQGKLLDHRPFQICSPIEMVKHCLAQTDCPVIATLHPSERYSSLEIQALDALKKTHARLTVQIGGMNDLILGCDYIVTQNSSVAFNGYLFGKSALLFRKTDFHHIAVQADLDDLATGFAAVKRAEPDYPAYVHWYWQQNSINAGRPEAEERIAARLKRFGWPV